MFVRQCILYVKAVGTASICCTCVAVLHDLAGFIMCSLRPIAGIVPPCGNRQRFSHGGNDEYRICRSPASDPTAAGWSRCRRDLSAVRSSADLVSLVVAALPSARPQWVV